MRLFIFGVCEWERNEKVLNRINEEDISVYEISSPLRPRCIEMEEVEGIYESKSTITWKIPEWIEEFAVDTWFIGDFPSKRVLFWKTMESEFETGNMIKYDIMIPGMNYTFLPGDITFRLNENNH